MTADHSVVRRLLARVSSAETMARIVDPTLADMHAEAGRSPLVGYVALGRALALHAVMSAPDAVAQLWIDDEHAVPRALAVWALATILLAAPLVAIPASSALRISRYAVVLLAPQALAVALPMSLLIAIPVAFRKASNRHRLLVRGLAMSMLCAAATLIVIITMIPDANQAFRVEVMKRVDPHLVHIPRGPLEMTLHELRERIQALQLTPDGRVAARRYEYDFQMKLALSAISLPLGLLAMAITVAARGRARAIAIGIGSAFGYVYGMFALDAWFVKWLDRSDAVSPTVLAWAPTMLILALAAAAFWRLRIRVMPCT